ncbi:MAG TPA: metallopeptidase TldD-related protein, partial [Capillimicrobium sp.]
VTVHVLCVADGHTGGAACTALDRDALAAAARRARQAAEAAARSGSGGYPGLPAPSASPLGASAFDARTAALDPADAADALAAAFAAADERGLTADGMWTAGDVVVGIASSHGAALTDRATDAYLKVIARDADGRAGFAAAAGRGVGALDGAAVARHAANKVSAAEPAVLGPGEWPVVLDADAVGELLGQLAGLAFNGLAHAEGRGALAGRLGTAVAAPAITITDAPAHPLAFPRAFDAEGVPKRELALVADGVARAVAHDTRSAALAGNGAASTGHALEPGGSPWGPAPTSLVLAGGDAASVEELAAPIERGLYVTRLWYTNAVHERSATVTGVTREGTFLIEDGRIAAPLRDVRFTDSVLRILEATEALSAAQRLVSEADFYGTRAAIGTVAPALRAGGFRISGGA